MTTVNSAISLTYCDIQRKPISRHNISTAKGNILKRRRTLAVTHPLHHRAHEDLNRTDILERDLALRDVTVSVSDSREGSHYNDIPCRLSATGQDDYAIHHRPLHQERRFCFQEPRKEPLTALQWTVAHPTPPWTRGNVQSRRYRQGRRCRRLQGSSLATIVELCHINVRSILCSCTFQTTYLARAPPNHRW